MEHFMSVVVVTLLMMVHMYWFLDIFKVRLNFLPH